MKRKLSILLLTGLVLAGGCGFRSLKPSGYMAFVEDRDNGYVKSSVLNNWQYRVQYRPSSYICLQETRGDVSDKASFEKRKQQLRNWRFFNVYTSHKLDRHASPIRLVSTGLEDYNRYLGYYLAPNRGNFLLLSGRDTLSPVIYQFENNYNLSPEDVFVVGFELSPEAKAPEDMTLVYRDEVLKTGILSFRFAANAMQKEPSLLFN
jgi:hypothetical protein